LSIRAVIFDYGMVLTGPPVQRAHDGMVRITGLSVDEFEKLYWADRRAYDEGKLSGTTFWQKFKETTRLPLTDGQLEELYRLDAQMWTASDPAMLAWHEQLKAQGIRTAILSNMGDSVLENIEREFAWIHRFDAQVWSFQLGMAKPDAGIYRHALEKLETRPKETLFLDDKQANIDAACELGIEGMLFTNVNQLRRDLVTRRFDRDLPLPALPGD
jgi:putative hydrolase of the HAD superfamily